jgi:hypothetical protein
MDLQLHATATAQPAPRPPLLASEALRRDLVPATPAARSMRILLVVIGLLGVVCAMYFVGPFSLGAPIGGAFAALLALGLSPVAYEARAAVAVAVAGAGLLVATWDRTLHGAAPESLLLQLGVTVLATALLLRGWHRGSRLARGLVALGIAICAGWLPISEQYRALPAMDLAWQTWLGPLLMLPLAVLLLLSLLAFMDSRSTGACGLSAALLLGWYALSAAAGVCSLYWPLRATLLSSPHVDGEITLGCLAGPLFTSVVATALAQLLAAASATRAWKIHGPT